MVRLDFRVKVLVFSATFENISAISRRSPLLVEETCKPVLSKESESFGLVHGV